MSKHKEANQEILTAARIKELLADKHAKDIGCAECKNGASYGSDFVIFDYWTINPSWAHPNNKIEQIKSIRQFTGKTLVEAKELADDLWSNRKEKKEESITIRVKTLTGSDELRTPFMIDVVEAPDDDNETFIEINRVGCYNVDGKKVWVVKQ